MRRIVIIDQAPSRTSDPAAPFSGRSGARLRELMGPAFDRAERRNLLPEYPGRAAGGSQGDGFPVEAARTAAAKMMPALAGSNVVLAGIAVAKAFRISTIKTIGFCTLMFPNDAGSWFVEVLVIPHPSGVVRWWNDPYNVSLARAALRNFCRA